MLPLSKKVCMFGTNIVGIGGYYPRFQASIGDLGTCAPGDKGDYCTFTVSCVCNSLTRLNVKGAELLANPAENGSYRPT